MKKQWHDLGIGTAQRFGSKIYVTPNGLHIERISGDRWYIKCIDLGINHYVRDLDLEGVKQYALEYAAEVSSALNSEIRKAI